MPWPACATHSDSARAREFRYLQHRRSLLSAYVHTMTASCAALTAASTSISGPLLPSNNSSPVRVKRVGSSLSLDDKLFRPVGPNIYWLGPLANLQAVPHRELTIREKPGLAQDPQIGYPSHGQVQEILSTASVMGGNCVRAHTLGVSVGCDLCLLPKLGKFSDDAFDHIDFALYAARAYGLRLVVPLTDHWD